MAIIAIAAIVVFALLAAYLYAIFNNQGSALADIEREMNTVWDKLIPIGTNVLSVVSPIIIVLLALVLLRVLGRTGASPFDLAKTTSDLPSTLALIIVITICLLPLAGVDVPPTLNNIALVVVGFYFGKRETERSV